jgi:hypothetical protein
MGEQKKNKDDFSGRFSDLYYFPSLLSCKIAHMQFQPKNNKKKSHFFSRYKRTQKLNKIIAYVSYSFHRKTFISVSHRHLRVSNVA